MKKYRIKYDSRNCLFFLQERIFFKWSNVVKNNSTMCNASKIKLKQVTKEYLFDNQVDEYIKE